MLDEAVAKSQGGIETEALLSHLRQALCKEASLCVIDLPSSNSSPGMPLGFQSVSEQREQPLHVQPRPQGGGECPKRAIDSLVSPRKN